MDKKLLEKSQLKLEKLWDKLADDFKPFRRDVSVADNSVSAFTYYVEMGKYPPPEIMVEIMEGFLNYFESEGNISLDQAFFGDKHKKYNSRSFKQYRQLKFSDFDRFIYFNDFKSLDQGAEQFLIETESEIDQDTFLREYRRWKVGKKKRT